MSYYRCGPSGNYGGGPAGLRPKPENNSWRLDEIEVTWDEAIKTIYMEWEDGTDHYDSKLGQSRGDNSATEELGSDEYVVKVEGNFGKPTGGAAIYGIKFIMNNGNTFSAGTKTDESDFNFRYEAPPGCQIIGLYGRHGSYVDAVGAYLALAPSSE